MDDHYVIYSQMTEEGQFRIRLFCVDPSVNLQKCIDKSNSTIFFSATLLPIGYYKRLLSTDEDNYAIYAQSTFAQTQRLLAFGRDVSTKYTRRNRKEYEKSRTISVQSQKHSREITWCFPVLPADAGCI